MRRETITSAQNPKIKELLELSQSSKHRRESGLFVVEGQRELTHCLEAGYGSETFFICPKILSDNELKTFTSKTDCRDLLIVEVPDLLYDKIAYRGGTEGIVAVMKAKEHSLDKLQLRENPLVVVIESVEKPGNLGAVLRSADAAGANAVIVCDPLTDLYNPNLIRASIGAVFSRQIAVASTPETIAWLKKQGIKILTAQLQDSDLYYDTNMTGGVAIVMGAEATGLSDDWRSAANARLRIPMLGQLDSLNVSVSAAILLYEAVRQRHTNQCL